MQLCIHEQHLQSIHLSKEQNNDIPKNFFTYRIISHKSRSGSGFLHQSPWMVRDHATYGDRCRRFCHWVMCNDVFSAMGFEEQHQAFHQLRHKPVVQFLHGIRNTMIVGVAEKSSVRYHDRLKSLIPKRGMVTESDRRQDSAVKRNF